MARKTCYCKGCGKKIVWIQTVNGKSMPCDPGMVTYWEKPGAAGKVITPNGMTLSCEFEGDIQNATGIGYRPHWATCPEAKKFKEK